MLYGVSGRIRLTKIGGISACSLVNGPLND
jgi:hypothetical protein